MPNYNVLLFVVTAVSLAVLGGVLFKSQKDTNAQNGHRPEAIPGQYIVVLRDTVQNPQNVADDMAKVHGLSLEHVYTTALKGFSATVPTARLEQIKRDPRVQFVSEDRVVRVVGQTTPTGISRVRAPLNATNKGAGIGVAVLDTGIDLTHPDLKNNIVANKSCVKGVKTGNDDHGHGTVVAGAIAALDNAIGVVGVAPQTNLIAVKVLDSTGNGAWSQVICGINWITANKGKYAIKVVNMSLGDNGTSDNNCGNSNNDALHKAICKSTEAGITYIAGAGNGSVDASTFVPAAYDDTVITVSALADSDGQPGGLGVATSYGADDTFASFSNYGSVVDLGAPGVAVLTTTKNGGYGYAKGTSISAPYVAGAAALYIKSNPGVVWSQVSNGLKAVGEALNSGHTDPSGLHPEPVVLADTL